MTDQVHDRREAFSLCQKALLLEHSKAPGARTEALALMERAAELDPFYEAQLPGLRARVDRAGRAGKVSFARALSRVVAPWAKENGFTGPVDRLIGGRCYERVLAGSVQRLSLAPHKFGRLLAVLLLVEEAPEPAVWLGHHDLALSSEDLGYVNQEELEAAMELVVTALARADLPSLLAARRRLHDQLAE